MHTGFYVKSLTFFSFPQEWKMEEKRSKRDLYDGYHCAKKCKLPHGNFIQLKIM